MSIYLELGVAYPIIFGSCLLGFGFGLYNWWKVQSILNTGGIDRYDKKAIRL